MADPGLFFGLIIIALLIFANAFFVASEFAIVKIRKTSSPPAHKKHRIPEATRQKTLNAERVSTLICITTAMIRRTR